MDLWDGSELFLYTEKLYRRDETEFLRDWMLVLRILLFI